MTALLSNAQPVARLGALFVLVLTCSCSSPELSESVTLVPTEQHEIAVDHDYEIQVEVDKSANLLITATQGVIDVGLALIDPEHVTIEVNSPNERDGTETLFHLATNPGVYRVRLFSKDHRKASGHSSLTIQALPQETKSDRLRIRAEQAFSEGARLSLAAVALGDASQKDALFRNALNRYEESAELWKRLGDQNRTALAIYSEATLHYELGEWELTAKTAKRANKYCQSEQQRNPLCARILHRHAEALIETGNQKDLDVAGGLLQQARSLQEEQGDGYAAAVTINTLGRWYYELGDAATAHATIAEAGQRLEALDEEKEASKTYNNLAKIYERVGKSELALDAYRNAVRLARAGGYDYELSAFLEGSADTLRTLGHIEEALLRYHEAADVAKRIGERLGEARALDGIGRAYASLGSWNTAADFLDRSLDLHEGTSELRPLIETHIHLGNIYRNLSNYSEAIDAHEKALKLSDGKAERAAAHLELGRDRTALNDKANALEHFDKAIEFAEDSDVPLVGASALTERGALKATLAPKEGLTELLQALERHQDLSSDYGIARTHVELAKAHRASDNLTSALEHVQQALARFELLRKRIGHASLRYTYTGLQWPTYALAIDLLMQLHAENGRNSNSNSNRFDAMALEVSEYLHALTLVELMNDARSELNNSAGDPLRQQHRQLRRELAEIASSNPTEKKQNQPAKSINAIVAELDVIEAKIRGLNPSVKPLDMPKVRVAEIQQLLNSNDNALLLEYYLGEKNSVLWAVTTETVESWQLPPRSDIERLALDAYAGLRSPPTGGYNRNAKNKSLQQLSNLLLGPVETQLADRTVLVVPDGALHYVPFAALLIPNSKQHLLSVSEIVTLPSASLLLAQRKAFAGRDSATKSIAVIADPVFSSRDPRMLEQHQVDLVLEERSAVERGQSLTRLPYTADEAAAIIKTAGSQRKVLALTGLQATKENLLASHLEDYQIVHFASHGLIDSSQPQLSAIALSAYDETGTRVNNLLQLDDVYELRLNADLVILSACDTALGLHIRGEGLIGMVHAFMYAGAKGVLATHWAVQDKATARLMSEFYSKLLNENMRPSNALRLAQLAIAKTKSWQDPYFWAPFVFQGEWRL